MKRVQLVPMVLAAVLLFVVGCGSKTDEALLAEYNAKKGEAEKLIADVTEGMKKLNDEHAAWLTQVSAATAHDSVAAASMAEKLHMHESMIPTVQAGVDSLKFYVNSKATNDDEIKTATAGLNAHLAAVAANWKALWEAHTKAGAEVTAALATISGPAASSDSEATTTTTTTQTTTTTKKSSEKKATATTGKPKVAPANVKVEQSSGHETEKKTPGGKPKVPPTSGTPKQ